MVWIFSEGHGKQGSWHLFSEEPDDGYAISQSTNLFIHDFFMLMQGCGIWVCAEVCWWGMIFISSAFGCDVDNVVAYSAIFVSFWKLWVSNS